MRAPGWYPDGAGQVRFWDGRGWTLYTSIPAYDAIGRSDPRELPPPTDDVEAVPSNPPTRAELVALTGCLGVAVAVIALFLPFLPGLIGGLLGLALSIIGTAEPGPARAWAVTGIVLSAAAIVLIV